VRHDLQRRIHEALDPNLRAQLEYAKWVRNRLFPLNFILITVMAVIPALVIWQFTYR
jgi:hypothetical protein